MNLYIKIEKGHPINHPIREDNLYQAFPSINLIDNEEYVPFTRLTPPADLKVGDLQVLASEYILDIDGISYTDNYYIRDMTDDEVIEATDNRIKGLQSTLQAFLEVSIAQFEISDELDKPIWQSYIDSLNNFTYDDPFKVVIPKIPLKDKNGNWLSIQNSGTKPNVIG